MSFENLNFVCVFLIDKNPAASSCEDNKKSSSNDSAEKKSM